MAQKTLFDFSFALEIAADQAAEKRAQLRKTFSPGDPDREQAISNSIREIDKAMKAARPIIGRLPYLDTITQESEDRLRAASRRAQYERRQIKKMSRIRPSL